VTGEWHHSRDSITEVPITLQLDADVSVASGNTVGKIITYKAV
jgi:hypothetical protein